MEREPLSPRKEVCHCASDKDAATGVTIITPRPTVMIDAIDRATLDLLRRQKQQKKVRILPWDCLKTKRCSPCCCLGLALTLYDHGLRHSSIVESPKTRQTEALLLSNPFFKHIRIIIIYWRKTKKPKHVAQNIQHTTYIQRTNFPSRRSTGTEMYWLRKQGAIDWIEAKQRGKTTSHICNPSEVSVRLIITS